MGCLGLGMHADHPEGCARARRDGQFERRFGPGHGLGPAVGVDVEAHLAVEGGRAAWGGPAGIVAGGQHGGVVQQGDFLLGLGHKADHRGGGPQAIGAGEGLEREHAVAAAARVGRFDHHDGVGVEREEDRGDGGGLVGARHVAPARPAVVGDEAALVVKERVEPFDVPGGDPHGGPIPCLRSRAPVRSPPSPG